MKKCVAGIIGVFVLAGCLFAQQIRFVNKAADNRIDVLIDGKLFTSYRFDPKIKRPVLFPIMSPGGSFVTRGFPFELRDGQTIDHPHQVGSSLSYGDVNGIDFWNTSTFRSAKELEKMGSIVHRKILKMAGGPGSGELATESDWVLPNGKPIMREVSRYIFRASGGTRIIDRETKFTANNGDVFFGDNKEGMFAIRLASELEQEGQTDVRVTAANGQLFTKRNPDQRPTGAYFNSEGLAGDNVWGTRGKWVAVAGTIGKENVTVAIFDDPKNTNSPPYMMVRGYGLLAVNPFGQKSFDGRLQESKFVLNSGLSLVFHHRIVIVSGTTEPKMIEKMYQEFLSLKFS